MVPDDDHRERQIHHRRIEPDVDVATTDLVRIVAELEGCAIDQLPSLWSCIDDVVSDVFAHPPDPTAQVHVQFSYVGYRIDVDQSGHVELLKVGDSRPPDR